ncbi:hypothetical protein LTR15_004138 [Elasticomyces elasticus]|nr:hypothetical protein LTR15_004138 [Elasticomyces elasticus]
MERHLASFVQTELVNDEHCEVLEETLGAEDSMWHGWFVKDHADFADSKVNINVYLLHGDKTAAQRSRIALLLRKMVSAAAVPGAEDPLDISKKTAVYRLRQAATLILTLIFDVQTRGSSSQFHKLLKGKSVRPFKKIIVQNKAVRTESIIASAAVPPQSTMALINTLTTIAPPMIADSNAKMSTLATEKRKIDMLLKDDMLDADPTDQDSMPVMGGRGAKALKLIKSAKTSTMSLPKTSSTTPSTKRKSMVSTQQSREIKDNKDEAIAVGEGGTKRQKRGKTSLVASKTKATLIDTVQPEVPARKGSKVRRKGLGVVKKLKERKEKVDSKFERELDSQFIVEG